MNNGRIKFYCQLVADTLLVISLQGVNHKHNLLSSFDSIYDSPLNSLKMKSLIFVILSCHLVEFQFIRRTQILVYM